MADRPRSGPIRGARSYTPSVTSSLNATFEVLPLADLVLLLSANRSTGVLRVGGEQACDLWLVDGEFTFAARADDSTLDEVLVRQGIAPAEAVAATAARPGQGAALVATGVDADRLRGAVQDRIVETLFPLLLAPDATFDLVEGDAHPFGAGFGLGVQEALDAARRRLEDWKAIASSIPSLAATVTLLATLPGGVDEVRVPAVDWAVLALVDGRRSVSDLVRDSGRSAYDVCMAVHRLVAVGAAALRD